MTTEEEKPTGTDADATGDDKGTTAAPDTSAGKVEPKKAPEKKESKGEEDYEARFKGLQPKVQELAEANKIFGEERLTHLGRIGELEGLLDAETKKTEQSVKDVEAATKAQEESQGAITTLEEQAERTTLIMSEFPDLAVMEAKGLIAPGLKGDELKTKLTDLRSILKTKGVAAIEELGAGSTSVEETKTGSRTQGDTVSSIDQLMQTAMKAGDMTEVDRLEDLLIERANIEVYKEGGAPAT